jgi:hypothetical protein
VCILLWLWCGVCLDAGHTEPCCMMESSGTAVHRGLALGCCMYPSVAARGAQPTYGPFGQCWHYVMIMAHYVPTVAVVVQRLLDAC